jgi:hypothetical protein
LAPALEMAQEPALAEPALAEPALEEAALEEPLEVGMDLEAREMGMPQRSHCGRVRAIRLRSAQPGKATQA